MVNAGQHKRVRTVRRCLRLASLKGSLSAATRMVVRALRTGRGVHPTSGLPASELLLDSIRWLEALLVLMQCRCIIVDCIVRG